MTTAELEQGHAPAESLIQVRGLGKRLGHRWLVKDVSFSLEPGQTLVITGPNGAGKTTLLRLLAQVIHPTDGVITAGGQLIDRECRWWRQRLGFLDHDPHLYPDLTAWENLMFFGRLYDVPELESRITDSLRRVELNLFAHEPVKTFSRGMTQRLGLARAILHQPPVLLLDEPHTGLDPGGRQAVEQVMQASSRQTIMATHRLEWGYRRADAYLVLEGGRVVERGLTTAPVEEWSAAYRQRWDGMLQRD